MKKSYLIVILIFILSLVTVSGANPPSIVTNSTSNVLTESFVINTGVNETSLISYSVSTGGSEVIRSTLGTNSTSAQIIIGNLVGNTAYTWQVNFTSLGENTVIRNAQTTAQYRLTGVTRTILNLFAFIVVGLFAVGWVVMMSKTVTSVRSLLMQMVTGMLLVIVLARWITSILGL